MKVYCYNDHKGWGQMFGQAFRKYGFDVKIFNSDEQIPNENNLVYMMQHHNPKFREHDKKLTSKLAAKDKIKMIPSHLENLLYDDKIKQYQELSAYIPSSFIITNKKDAYNILNKLTYPFISKSAQGAASSNVDIIKTEQEARLQIEQAFGEGIERHYGLKQKGYLFWQKFLPKNEYAYKILMIGNKYSFVVKKKNRPNIALASGSKETIQIKELNDEILQSIMFCSYIAQNHQLSFTGMDIIFDYANYKTPKLLEITTDWAIDCNLGCRIFKRVGCNWTNTELIIKSGQDMFDLAPKVWGTECE